MQIMSLHAKTKGAAKVNSRGTFDANMPKKGRESELSRRGRYM